MYKVFFIKLKFYKKIIIHFQLLKGIFKKINNKYILINYKNIIYLMIENIISLKLINF